MGIPARRPSLPVPRLASGNWLIASRSCPMPIKLRCPACATPHNLADNLAGKKIRCKSCKAVVAVPGTETLAAPDAVAVSAPASAAPAAALGHQEPEALPPAMPPRGTQAPPKKRRTSTLARRIETFYTAAILCLILGIVIFVVGFMLVQGMRVTGTRGTETVVALAALAVEGIALLLALVATIMLLVWLARTWRAVPAEFGGMAPLKSVGLLFVPWFNIYWMFRAIPGLSATLSRALRSYDPGAPAQAGYGAGVTACVLSLVPGLNVLTLPALLLWLRSAARAANRLSELAAAGPPQTPPQPAPKRLLLGCALAGAAAVLLPVLTLGAAAAAWYLFLAPVSPEEHLIGRWHIDRDPAKRTGVPPTAVVLDFQQDGTGAFGIYGEPKPGTWKVRDRKGSTLTLEVQNEDLKQPMALKVTPKGKDRLAVVFVLLQSSCEMVRGPA